MASPPSIIASEEPVVAVPMACLADGACQRFARIETQRVWIFSVVDHKWVSTEERRSIGHTSGRIFIGI